MYMPWIKMKREKNKIICRSKKLEAITHTATRYHYSEENLCFQHECDGLQEEFYR
jgi:hypothetical protein